MPADPYRRIALVYDSLFESGAWGLAGAALEMVSLPAGARILDVGCGTGILLQRCVERGLEAHGVDPSPAMLGKARQRLGRSATLHEISAQRLPFADGELDGVFATMVLHELAPETRAQTLTEMTRVTSARGVLAIAEYHDGPVHGIRGWLNKLGTTAAELAAGRAHWAGYRHFKRHGCVPGMVADAPLRIVAQRILAGGTLAVHVLMRS